VIGLQQMGDMTRRMTRDALEAFLERDRVRAEEAVRRAGFLEILRDQAFLELLDYMMAEPEQIPRALAWNLIVRNFEQAGTHAARAAEAVLSMLPEPEPAWNGGREPGADFGRS
jgi:phosphate transport system protein